MKRTSLRVALSICCAFFGVAACAQQPADPRVGELRGKLAGRLEQIAREFDGVMGIAVKELTGGETFLVNADMVFPQASSIKIAILVEVLRQAQPGTLRLDERVEVRRTQMVGGSGVLQRFGDATSAISLRDLATLMITLSDNTATNILIDRIGLAKVNQTLEQLRLRNTRLRRRMMDVEARRAGRENLSTPREMATLLELLHQGKLLDPAHTAMALEILSYPKESALRRGLPENVVLANKPGSIEGVRCDSGIVLLEGRPYAVAVMTTYVKDPDVAERAIAEVSRQVFSYFERMAHSGEHGARLP